MTKYRQKPKYCSAIQYTSDNVEDCLAFCVGAVNRVHAAPVGLILEDCDITIVRNGDYLLRDEELHKITSMKQVVFEHLWEKEEE